MMQTIIDFIANYWGNFGIVAVITGLVGWTLYKALLNVFFSEKNIDQIGDGVKIYISKIKDSSARLLTKKKIIYICVDIIYDLGFGFIVRPDWKKNVDNFKG